MYRFEPLPSPRPCGPFSNTCSSNGTLFFRKAIAKARLFSIGTPLSPSVWARNVGGVFSVTWVSLDSSVNCSLEASDRVGSWPNLVAVLGCELTTG